MAITNTANDDFDQRFGLSGCVTQKAGNGGLTKICVSNPHAVAELYLFGGQVMQYTPTNKSPVLWTSPNAILDGSKAIRGGIPICWPWFSAHPTDKEAPSHGFARNREWTLVSTSASPDKSIVLELELLPDATTLSLFPHPFRTRLLAQIGHELKVSLQVQNTGDAPFPSGPALHTYFAVDDIANTQCTGLEDVEFIDNLDGKTRKRETSGFGFDRELERVYVNSEHTVRLADGKRTIEIAKEGSRTTIVWNPWIEKSIAMSDCIDDGYKSFVCVETGNVGQDVRTIAPGETHVVSQTIRA